MAIPAVAFAQVAPRTSFTEEDTAVLVTILRTAELFHSDTLFVIDSTMALDSMARQISLNRIEYRGHVRPETAADFFIEDHYQLPLASIHVPERLSRFVSMDLVGKHDLPYVGLSRVGFSTDRTQAIVHVWHVCGMLCGYAELVLLHHATNGWMIDWRSNTMMF